MGKRAIWKYPVHLTDQFGAHIPEGAEVLSVQVQHGEPQMWVLVEPDAPQRYRNFRVVGTGHPFDPAGWDFVGTFQISGGDLVFHLFEER